MRGNKWLSLLTLVLLVAGCAKATPTATPKPTAFDPRPYVGRYEGPWTNQTVGTTGTCSVEIKTDNNRRTATVSVSFTGPYFGLPAPLAATLTGGWDAKEATISGKSTISGDLAVTVDMAGKIAGTMKGAAEGKYDEATISGVITAQRIDADYQMKSADGTAHKFILRLTKK